MTDQAKKYLSDVLQAIELIEQFTENTNDYNEYLLDLKTQSAVERQLGIIGEALNHFGKLFQQQPIENAHKIIGFRNRLIHTYDSIDSSIVWTIIKKHLGHLKSEVIKKLKF